MSHLIICPNFSWIHCRMSYFHTNTFQPRSQNPARAFQLSNSNREKALEKASQYFNGSIETQSEHKLCQKKIYPLVFNCNQTIKNVIIIKGEITFSQNVYSVFQEKVLKELGIYILIYKLIYNSYKLKFPFRWY